MAVVIVWGFPRTLRSEGREVGSSLRWWPGLALRTDTHHSHLRSQVRTPGESLTLSVLVSLFVIMMPVWENCT